MNEILGKAPLVSSEDESPLPTVETEGGLDITVLYSKITTGRRYSYSAGW